jgi:effector-binding domain-containing protein
MAARGTRAGYNERGAVNDPVTEMEVPEVPTAVVAETTTWAEFPKLWRVLLAEVWTVVRGNDEIAPGRNVMLYKDDVPNVEVGAEVGGSFSAQGRVSSSCLPAGRVVTTKHRGSYHEIGEAHRAVIEWCDSHGLERVGPRWEIYGHATEREADQEVDVFYLVR